MKAAEAVCALLDALAAAGLHHMVTGGLVANAHGIARSTKDADIKDRDDARNILAVQGDALDFAYIGRWCDTHGTRARLEELRRSIPPM